MMFHKIESDMYFGDYPSEDVFEIENSELHYRAGLSSGISTVEFIYLKDNKKLLFIEAKRSSPRKETSLERYNEWLEEITNKFVHSFNMYLASKLNRLQSIDGSIGNVSDSDVSYEFVLVIKGHQESWLPPLKAELDKKLSYNHKIWKSKIVVLNDTLALKRNLIKVDDPQ